MRVITQADQVVLKFEGIEQLYAFCRQLVVVRDQISSITFEPVFKDWQKIEFRAPGSFLPGVILAGSFYTSNGWDFIYGLKPRGWTRPVLEKVLVITTTKRRYRRIIVSIGETQAKEIISWFNKTK
jgi:hypothetical protein